MLLTSLQSLALQLHISRRHNATAYDDDPVDEDDEGCQGYEGYEGHEVDEE